MLCALQHQRHHMLPTSPGDADTFSEGFSPSLFACSFVPISAWLSWPTALLHSSLCFSLPST